jgi:hypothetical protein
VLEHVDKAIPKYGEGHREFVGGLHFKHSHW